MTKKLLLIGDMVGYGDLGMSAMIPILSHKGCSVMNLPTALVSNNFAYRKYGLMTTTDYMRQTLRVWQELGFTFDAVATGFVVSEEQARMVAEFCRQQSEAGTPIIVDPIMGDDGTLYSGIPEAIVGYMRQLCSVATLILPNFTEACYLVGREQRKSLHGNEVDAFIDSLRAIGARSVIVSSANVDGQPSVLGYDAANDERFVLPYTEIPVSLPGTGDMFSSVIIPRMLQGEPLRTAAKEAVDIVYRLIDKNRDLPDPYRGIVVSRVLDSF